MLFAFIIDGRHHPLGLLKQQVDVLAQLVHIPAEAGYSVSQPFFSLFANDVLYSMLGDKKYYADIVAHTSGVFVQVHGALLFSSCNTNKRDVYTVLHF